MRRLVLAASVVGATAGIVLGAVYGGLEGGDVLWPLTWFVWAPVGGMVLLRRPGNGVGVAMLAIGVAWGVGFAFLALAASSAPLEVRVWGEMMNVLFGVLPWLGIIWLLLVFPSGALEGRLERVTGLGLFLVAAFGVLSFAVSPAPMETTGMPSPLAISWMGDATDWFVSDGFIVVVVLLAASVVSLARRWRHSIGVERHQYRWLVLGGVVFVSILGLAQVAPEDGAAQYSWIVAAISIPAAVGVAVTRYRLFEIDRIISRTVSYALIVGLLVSAVAGVAALAGAQFQEPWVVASTTLGVAAVFNPVRKRIQLAVDRRFNRSKYNAERVASEFASSLRDGVDPADVVNGWVAVISETMHPEVLGVWVKS